MASIVDGLSAHHVAQIIAAQRRRPVKLPEHMRLLVECLDVLPVAPAETAADALALLVVARQTIHATIDASMTEEDQAEAFEWSAALVDRVIAMLELSSGLAAESFSGITPAMN